MSGINFAGLLNLQKDHLLDLGNSTSMDDTQAGTYISDIAGDLDKLKDAYQEKDITTRDIVTHQNDVVNLVNNETTRLNQKKSNIDLAIEGQKRMITLNDSYRMRYRYYLYIVITILITTILYVVIKFLSNYLTFIPGAVYDLLLIIIFFAAIYIIYMTYLDIIRRDSMDFNKLNFNRPKEGDAKADASITNVGADSEQDATSVEVCKGQECCDGVDGIIYDETAGKCIEESGFSLINGLVKANDPNEFANYSKY